MMHDWNDSDAIRRHIVSDAILFRRYRRSDKAGAFGLARMTLAGTNLVRSGYSVTSFGRSGYANQVGPKNVKTWPPWCPRLSDNWVGGRCQTNCHCQLVSRQSSARLRASLIANAIKLLARM